MIQKHTFLLEQINAPQKSTFEVIKEIWLNEGGDQA
jgi:hypothetical protein